jgi:hypothetical protein
MSNRTRKDSTMTDTQVTDHIIKHLRQLDTSEVGNGERQLHASWHQVA